MKAFKSQKQQETYSAQQPEAFQDLTGEEMEEVNGGLNPQPLPPLHAKPTSSFPEFDDRGIIIVSGSIQ